MSVAEAVYEDHGIRFRYPEDWQIQEESEGETVSVTVSGPETSFWSIWILPERPDPERLVLSAIEAFEEDYDDVDVYRSEGELCDFPSLQCDVEFVSLELINSAFVRAFRTGRFSVLVLFQGTDHELEYTREALDAITASLECDRGDDILLA